MSRFAPEESEAFAGLLFEQPLNFELGFRGARERHSQMEHGLALWRSSFERRLDQDECRTAQNSIDQKEIVEPICVNSRNPPPLRNSHFHFPAARAAASAMGKISTSLTFVTSEHWLHPILYGDLRAQVDSTFAVPCGGTKS